MAFSDTLIELLSFSKDELRAVAESFDLKLPPGEKYEQAEWLAEQITPKQLREAAEEHLGAGRSSLSWVLLKSAKDRRAADDGDEHVELATAATLTVAEVAQVLAEMTGKTNPFRARLRPDVKVEPQLANLQYDGGDLVFLTFVHEKSHRRIVRNWAFQRAPEDAFFHAVLRLSRGVLEVRADGLIAKRLTKGWISEFAKALGREEQRLLLTNQDVEELADYLNARLDKHDARHEDEDAGYARQSVTAGVKQPDLRQLDRFKKEFKGSDPLSSDLLWEFVDAAGETHEIRLRISTFRGTVRCVNQVSNDVMEYVYDALRAVRDARVRALMQRTSQTG